MSTKLDRKVIESSWPTNDQYPIDTYAEILPGLFMGGTPDDQTVDFPQELSDVSDPKTFDAVVTLYSWAQPMGWGVEEMRYGFADASVENLEIQRILRIAKWAFDRWNSGEQVLIRCQVGLNRSGLVTALTMMFAGYEPHEAIQQIRRQRSELALFNYHYVTWLVSEAPKYFAEDSPSWLRSYN